MKNYRHEDWNRIQKLADSSLEGDIRLIFLLIPQMFTPEDMRLRMEDTRDSRRTKHGSDKESYGYLATFRERSIPPTRVICDTYTLNTGFGCRILYADKLIDKELYKWISSIQDARYIFTIDNTFDMRTKKESITI